MLFRSLLAIALVIFVVGSFGVGYFLLMRDENTQKAFVQERSADKDKYKQVIIAGDAFSKNLSTAKTILASEVQLSDLTFAIASTLPSGCIVDALTLNTMDLAKPMTLTIKTTSYANALAAKDAFEKSPYFENANIGTTSKTDEPNTPYGVRATLSITLTKDSLKPKATQQ